MNRWTLHVTDFGKIGSADVEVAPMTLFVGDNNSGKSYIMTLIYGLLNVRFLIDQYIFPVESESYRACCNIVKDMVGQVEKQTVEVTLNYEQWLPFEKLMNEILCRNKVFFLRRLFNRDMHIGELNISFPKEMKLVLCVGKAMDESGEELDIFISGKTDKSNIFSGYVINQSELNMDGSGYPFFISYIMQYMIQGEMMADSRTIKLYLPTARTGFMLTYKTLIGSAVREKFSIEETDKNLLTKPNSDFLTELSSMDLADEKDRFSKVVDFIEKNMILGHISAANLPAQEYWYIPDGSEKQLPLFVTSAVVTELTPLLLALKYSNLSALLIEEPEISLHPQLQWQVARVMIRLVNKGLPIFATTHSDIILQHINNMIKVAKLEDKEQFLSTTEYDEQDILNEHDINVHQFRVDEHQKTQIVKLPCGDYGFEAPTFIDTLQELNKEIRRIEDHR